jgi:SepF-like predicted cell division protein (DUF552 family)
VSFFDKVFETKKGEDIDIEDFLNNLDVEEEAVYDDADAFVKPISLQTNEDAQAVVDEAKAGNIVLLNISDLAKRNALKLRDLVTQIRDQIDEIDGDIARISHDRVLITPSKVKIIKKRA